MVAAAIQFTQGATVAPMGAAMFGVSGTSVVVANGNNAGPVVKWTFAVVDSPPASAIAPGVKQSGGSSTWTFLPDVPDTFLIALTVFDAQGNSSTDVRAFSILRTSGRFLPGFSATAPQMNYFNAPEALNARGWATTMEAWFNYLDGLIIGVGGGTDSTIVFTVSHTTTSSASVVPGSTSVFKGGKVRVDTPFNAGTLALGQTGSPNLLLPPSGAGSIDVVGCPAGTIYDLDPDNFITLANLTILATVAGASSGLLTVLVTYAVPLP